ncbi:MAG TPA: PQQ-binding-like beta-propeller repeat protein [Pirellulaceae bacterium]|nr:PQQ-binding-like beta-propeller repeat protein [Pirellulaceae bacterium]
MRAAIVSLVMLLIAAGCLPSATAAEWPEFRGPGKQGVATVRYLPIAWSETSNIAWKTALPGQGWSSPVVSGKLAFVTAAVPVGDEKAGSYELQAIAVDLKSGEIVWQTTLFSEEGGKAPKIHGKNSHASATPVIEAGKLYVHFGHMGSACLDLQGKVLWRSNEVKYEPVHGNGGSPVLVGGHLIFSCDGASEPRVVALDKESGKLKWQTPRPNDPPKKFAFCTPLVIEVNGRTQVVLPGAGAVCAYDPTTGAELWRVNNEGYSVIPRPVFGNGLVYVSTSYDSAAVLAIRPDGSGDVTDTHVVWTLKKGAPHTPSLLLTGTELYMVSDGGVASCVDALTGKSIWQERLGGAFSASPLLAENRIFLQDENGTAHVLAAGKKFQKLSENKLPERTLASYAAIDGAILLRGDKHLYRIEKGAKASPAK